MHTTAILAGNFLESLKGEVEFAEGTVGKILAVSGVPLNLITDSITSENIEWEKRVLKLDDLWLTSTTAEWDKIIIEKCQRSVARLREFIALEKSAGELFAEAKFNEIPILVKFEEGKYKVLDGMQRVVGGVKNGRRVISAFVAKQNANRVVQQNCFVKNRFV